MTSSVAPLNLLAGFEHFGKEIEGWNLVLPEESGQPREFLARIDFSVEFSGPPVVHVGLSGFDIANGDYARLRIAAQYIDRAGFTVCIGTSLGTRVHSVDVSWLALGT